MIAVDDPGPASRAVLERTSPEEAATASPLAVAAVFEPAAAGDPAALDAAALARAPAGSGLLASRSLAELLRALSPESPVARGDSSPP